MSFPPHAVETDINTLREQVNQLIAIIQYVDTFSPDRLPGDAEMGFNVEEAWNPKWIHTKEES